MNGKNLLKLLVVLAIIAFIGYTSLFGLTIGEYTIHPITEEIKLGLDLQGGVDVLMEAVDTDAAKVTPEAMEGAIKVINTRINSLGVAEPVVQKQGERRIRIQLPGISDPEKAIEVIGKTAQLEFIGPDGKVIITGADIKDAAPAYDANNQPVVSFELKSEGAKKFEEATGKFLGQPIAIVLDGIPISQPTVQAKISGSGQITGMESIEAAKALALQIRSGALPVKLVERQSTVVGPTLGKDSLDKSVTAGIYGIAAVLLFMLLYYRLPGLVADIALGIYVLLTLGILNAMGAVLTLPGIAGFLLSVGMAVDANVIIFERIKEEMKAGKSLRAAIDSGFKRAYTTIIDSNVTTIIAALVLFWLGTGPIRGFAVTLMVGVLASMFTAITMTRILIKMVVNTNLFGNKRLYGA